jgi:Flp pilus assembly protein CpaB
MFALPGSHVDITSGWICMQERNVRASSQDELDTADLLIINERVLGTSRERSSVPGVWLCAPNRTKQHKRLFMG